MERSGNTRTNPPRQKKPNNNVRALRAPVMHARCARNINYATPPDPVDVSIKFGQYRLSGLEMLNRTHTYRISPILVPDETICLLDNV